MRDTRRYPDPYQAIARFYDLEHHVFTDDLELYLSLALATGDPVLEIGCGTGRVLVPLAKAGHRITGIDTSDAMLDRARAVTRAADVDDRVSLHRGSMIESDAVSGGPFGLAIVALNGLHHVESATDQLIALEAIRNALDRRGQLVLDLINPTPDILRTYDHGVVHEGRWATSDGSLIDKFSSRRITSSQQTIATELWYDEIGPSGAVRRFATSYLMRYVHWSELELMLHRSGYTEWQVYGSYELDPYDDGSERMIVTAEVSTTSVNSR